MRTSILTFALAVFVVPAAQAQEPLKGDAAQGQSLFRMECAACHGPAGSGSEAWKKATPGKALPNLGDSAFLATRSDDELHAAMSTGHGKDRWIPGHAFSNLSSFQRWDIVQWLRDRSLSVAEFFPEAVQFTAKDFLIDEHGVQRLGEVKLNVPEAERDVVILTAYKGAKKANEGLRLIPWSPVELDLLKAGDRLGFLSFADLVVPRSGETIHVGFAFDTAGKLQRVRVRHHDPNLRAEYESALSSFVGQGSKVASEFKAPKNLRDGAAWAQAVTRAASLSAEAILMFDKSERARTAFDR